MRVRPLRSGVPLTKPPTEDHWMCWRLVCVVAFGLIVPNRAGADVDSYTVYSLEWLVDASRSVWVATVVRDKDGTTRIKSVDRVLKGPDEKPDPAVANLSDAVTAGGEN